MKTTDTDNIEFTDEYTLRCLECGSRQFKTEYQTNGPDDYDRVSVCIRCGAVYSS